MSRPDGPPRWTLAVRLSMLGLIQLLVLGLAAFVIGELTRPPPPHDLTARLDHATACVEAALGRGEDSTALERLLSTLALDHTLSFSLYDQARTLVATTSRPPVPVPPHLVPPHLVPPHLVPPHLVPPPFGGLPPQGRPPASHPFGGPPPTGGPSFERGPSAPIVRMLSSGHLLVARGEAPPGYVGPLLTALVGLLVIAAGALWTARGIVRPLERLSVAAERVGRGELDARAAIARTDEIGTVARGFDRMAERIEDMMRSERELLANVSHELRTPLARLRVALDLASEGHTEALEDVTADLEELEGIVADVLLAFRFEGDVRVGRSGLPVGALRETSVAELVGAAQKRFSVRHPTRRLELEPEPGSSTVLADPAVLRRAIDNVLDNAHKYTPDPEAHITLRVRRVAGQVEIAVTDRGIGIAPRDLSRVFEPFFRAERSRVRGAGGVGLGLTLARRIVEAHHGSIEARSELGVGTTVTIRLEAVETH